MDTSGAGVGPSSSAPPSLGRTPASTTAYEDTLANPPQRRGGLRGALGTATEIIGGIANVPALTQAGTRLSWQASPNNPGGARTPQEYQVNLQRLAAMSQIDQRNLQQQYLNQYRQERIQNQQEAQAFQRQKDQESRQQQFGTFQGQTEPLQQTANTGTVLPTPTAAPIPSSMIGDQRSMPPAFDPGTGAQKQVFGGAPFVTQPPDEQGKLLTRVDPSTQQPETRFAPSATTLRARNLAAASEQKQADMQPLEPQVDSWAVQNLGTAPRQKFAPADAKDIRDKAMVDMGLGKQPPERQPNEYADYKAAYKAKNPNATDDQVVAAFKASQRDPNEGSWQMAEDTEGKPILLNTKTAATKPAPGGVQRTGTAQKAKDALAKETEPVDSAAQYANDYLKGGVFTGAKDEALQEKFFELAKPSTGFRMSQPQMDMLQNSRSWMGSLEAKARHATTGTWFSATQRQQIVDAMNDLAKAKRAAISSARGGNAVPGPAGAPNDPLGIRPLIK